LFLGSVSGACQFFVGDLVEAGGFGLDRWISVAVNIVALPVALPLAVAGMLAALRALKAPGGLADFALLWLIPVAAMRAVDWGAGRDPLFLVMTPVLWTLLVPGAALFAGVLFRSRWSLAVPAGLGLVALPLAATTSFWAFYAQNLILGIVLLVVSAVPALCLVALLIVGRK